jgi:hypothetical protein
VQALAARRRPSPTSHPQPEAVGPQELRTRAPHPLAMQNPGIIMRRLHRQQIPQRRLRRHQILPPRPAARRSSRYAACAARARPAPSPACSSATSAFLAGSSSSLVSSPSLLWSPPPPPPPPPPLPTLPPLRPVRARTRGPCAAAYALRTAAMRSPSFLALCSSELSLFSCGETSSDELLGPASNYGVKIWPMGVNKRFPTRTVAMRWCS